MLRVRPEQTEKRRPEQHAGQHFRHHLRLAEAQSDRAHQPAEQKNDGELKEKLNGKMHVVHDSADFNGTEANRTTENLQ